MLVQDDQLHLGAGVKEAYTTEALRVAPKRSYTISTFRWLETIPYLTSIINILKIIKISILKHPQKHKTITGVRVVEIMPLPQKISPNQHLNPEELHFQCKAGKPFLINTAQHIDR